MGSLRDKLMELDWRVSTARMKLRLPAGDSVGPRLRCLGQSLIRSAPVRGWRSARA